MVDEAEVDAGEVGVGGAGVYLAVEGVAGLQDHLFARVGFDGRGDVGVPAVVSLGGFCGAGLGEVDLDGFHGGPPLIWTYGWCGSAGIGRMRWLPSARILL